MAQEIKIEIAAGVEGLKKALTEGSQLAAKFSKDLAKSFSPIRTSLASASNSIKDGLNEAFNPLVKGVTLANLTSTGILKAASAITSFATGSLSAAQQQEDAINRLSQALRASGSFSQAAVRDFEAFASGLQKVSLFGDEVVLGQLAIAKSFGATNEQAKQLVQAAANLSATFGGSLEERVQQLGKSLSGTAGRLGQFIPELQSLTQNQLRAGDAIDIVNKKFAGAAANEITTFSGRVTVLSNAISDFQEELGAFVTQGPTVLNVLKTFTSSFELFTSVAKNARKSLGIGLTPLEEERAKLKELGLEYNKVADQIKQRLQFAAQAAAQGNLQREQVFLKQAADLEKRRNDIIAQRTQIRGGIREDAQTQPTEAKAPATIVGEKELQQRAQINAQILQQQADFNVQRAQLDLQNDFLEDEKRIAAFEKLQQFESAKIEATRAADLERAKLIQDAGAKELAIQAANDKARLAQINQQTKGEVEQKRFLRQIEKQEFDTRIGIAQNFLAAGLALSKENSAAQKALAITQATISTYQGATNALADTRPAFLGPAVAASIVALGLANVARIAGAKFAQGGIVGGTSTQGDRVPALLNSREMVLNMGQQRELFDMANGSSRSNSSDVVAAVKELAASIRNAPIIVQANGREIARLIRDEQRNGFEVLA